MASDTISSLYTKLKENGMESEASSVQTLLPKPLNSDSSSNSSIDERVGIILPRHSPHSNSLMCDIREQFLIQEVVFLLQDWGEFLNPREFSILNTSIYCGLHGMRGLKKVVFGVSGDEANDTFSIYIIGDYGAVVYNIESLDQIPLLWKLLTTRRIESKKKAKKILLSEGYDISEWLSEKPRWKTGSVVWFPHPFEQRLRSLYISYRKGEKCLRTSVLYPTSQEKVHLVSDPLPVREIVYKGFNFSHERLILEEGWRERAIPFRKEEIEVWCSSDVSNTFCYKLDEWFGMYENDNSFSSYIYRHSILGILIWVVLDEGRLVSYIFGCWVMENSRFDGRKPYLSGVSVKELDTLTCTKKFKKYKSILSRIRKRFPDKNEILDIWVIQMPHVCNLYISTGEKCMTIYVYFDVREWLRSISM